MKTCETCKHKKYDINFEFSLCIQGDWPAVRVSYIVTESWPDGDYQKEAFLPACKKYKKKKYGERV